MLSVAILCIMIIRTQTIKFNNERRISMRKNKLISSALLGILVIPLFAGASLASPGDNNDKISKIIKSTLDKQASLDDDVSFDVNQGYVTLTGVVDSASEKKLAENLIKDISGVQGINNRLVVETSSTYSVKQNNEAINSNSQIKTDKQIQKNLQNQIYLSFKLDSNKVFVTVENGTVTLTGTAESTDARDLAERKALQAGAERIINDLTISQRS